MCHKVVQLKCERKFHETTTKHDEALRVITFKKRNITEYVYRARSYTFLLGSSHVALRYVTL